VEFWSPSVEALFGYAASEMPDEAAWYRLAYPDPAYRQRVLAAWEERVAEAQRTGRPLRPLEVEVRCKDGSRKTVEIAGSFADDRLLVLFIDLTARREAEVQREALHEAVARSQRMESVGRLAGGVAHDLNNLLSPILGYADLLLADAPRGSQQAQDLAELRGAAERARDLTRQLLAFGRRQVLVARPTDLRELVCGMVRLLRRTIPEDVRIDLDVSPALGLVRADPVQLEQVLMNLAVNAQDAMPGGGRLLFRLAEVAVTGHHPDRRRGVLPGRWAMLEVKDSGAGMAPEVLEHVFEPFFTTKSNGERSGLGLAIVDGVLTQHGGHVVVDSAPGQGTAFRIYLPLIDGGDAAPGPEHAAAGGEGTILLAEDESGVRAVTARMLERLGYRVLAAGDAGACERMITAERGPIDLLLTDVVMPDVNGPQLHERLSALQPGLRVLYMSGYAAEVVSGRGILDQGVPILQKPFTSAALGTAVRCALAAPAGPR
jgi:signal transduction histidine kinase